MTITTPWTNAFLERFNTIISFTLRIFYIKIGPFAILELQMRCIHLHLYAHSSTAWYTLQVILFAEVYQSCTSLFRVVTINLLEWKVGCITSRRVMTYSLLKDTPQHIGSIIFHVKTDNLHDRPMLLTNIVIPRSIGRTTMWKRRRQKV